MRVDDQTSIIGIAVTEEGRGQEETEDTTSLPESAQPSALEDSDKQDEQINQLLERGNAAGRRIILSVLGRLKSTLTFKTVRVLLCLICFFLVSVRQGVQPLLFHRQVGAQQTDEQHQHRHSGSPDGFPPIQRQVNTPMTPPSTNIPSIPRWRSERLRKVRSRLVKK